MKIGSLPFVVFGFTAFLPRSAQATATFPWPLYHSRVDRGENISERFTIVSEFRDLTQPPWSVHIL